MQLVVALLLLIGEQAASVHSGESGVAAADESFTFRSLGDLSSLSSLSAAAAAAASSSSSLPTSSSLATWFDDDAFAYSIEGGRRHVSGSHVSASMHVPRDSMFDDSEGSGGSGSGGQGRGKPSGGDVDEFAYTNWLAVNYIWPTFPIGFLVLGTVANILSIVVFLRREMRRFSSFCYFAVLNAVNLAVLYVTLMRVIMDYNFHTDIRTLSMFACKAHVFLTYFLGHLSSLLLCMISIDRVISVMFLRRAKDLCTPSMAKRVTLALIIFNFVLSSHFLLFESGYVLVASRHSTTTSTSININSSSSSNFSTAADEAQLGAHSPHSSMIVCETRNGTFYDQLVQNLWKIVDMSLYAFIPFAIMLVCSVIIIFKVAEQAKKFGRGGAGKGNNNKKRNNSTSTTFSSTRHKEVSSTWSQHHVDQVSNSAASVSVHNKFSSRTRNLALMLIPVNVLFLCFLAPVVISMYIYEKLSQDQLTLAIVEMLSYCNFTLNFFIYFLTSSKFRDEFFKCVSETCEFFSHALAAMRATNGSNSSAGGGTSTCGLSLGCGKQAQTQAQQRNAGENETLAAPAKTTTRTPRKTRRALDDENEYENTTVGNAAEVFAPMIASSLAPYQQQQQQQPQLKQ